MSKIDQWKKAKRIRQQSEEWMEMRKQICEYDGTPYVPRMDVNAKMYMCGQRYAGAPNYHEPPREMVQEFCRCVSSDWLSLAEKAIEKLKANEKFALLEAQEEISEAMGDIANEKPGD